MAIAASGAVSFSDLRTEFVGGSSAISYSDLYRGGSNIRTKAANNTGVNLAASVPTSGTINISNFRSQAKGFRFTYTSGATNQNASTLFGDDYAVNYPKEIVINSGVELGATSSSDEALQIDSGGSGSITITNNGTLSGAGGAAGSAGGDAFEADIACTLINNGTIRGGGGGGGTGGVGGNGSYTSTTTLGPYNSYSTHVHGAQWLSYYHPSFLNRYIRWGGSLIYSGAGTFNSYTSGSHTYIRGGLNGYNETVYYYNISRQTTSTTSSSGGSGGAGGVGAGYNQSSASGSSGVAGGTNAGTGGTGGTGGDFGSAGSTGNTGANGNVTNGAAGSSGGAAGNYIRGLSFVTLTQSGTVQGGTA